MHHRDIIPQFMQHKPQTFSPAIALGLSIITIGLFKKVVLADSLAHYVNPVFAAANSGQTLTFFETWCGAVGYTLQIYFDFSGYSDIAIGCAKVFNINLPLNFNSPYKAVNIIDFWRRWHTTLSQFFRDYLYIALGGNRLGRARQYVNLGITMTLCGLWHGAGWNFVFWGALHGFYLLINHLWINFRKKVLKHDLTDTSKLYRIMSQSLTFTTVCIGLVFFRTDTISAGANMVAQMFSLSHFLLPPVSLDSWLPSFIQEQNDWLGNFGSPVGLYWILAGLIIVFILPNTQQYFNYGGRESLNNTSMGKLVWQKNLLHLIIIATLLISALTLIFYRIVSELNTNETFIYFQF